MIVNIDLGRSPENLITFALTRYAWNVASVRRAQAGSKNGLVYICCQVEPFR